MLRSLTSALCVLCSLLSSSAWAASQTFTVEGTNVEVVGEHAVLATARTTSTALGPAPLAGFVLAGCKQDGNWFVFRGFVEFDSSAIPAVAIVTAVAMRVSIVTVDFPDADPVFQVHRVAWTSPLTDGNRETAYDDCLASTKDGEFCPRTTECQAGLHTATGLNTAWVNKGPSAVTQYCLTIDEDVAGTCDANSFVAIESLAAGSAVAAKLIVSYSMPEVLEGCACGNCDCEDN